MVSWVGHRLCFWILNGIFLTLFVETCIKTCCLLHFFFGDILSLFRKLSCSMMIQSCVLILAETQRCLHLGINMARSKYVLLLVSWTQETILLFFIYGMASGLGCSCYYDRLSTFNLLHLPVAMIMCLYLLHMGCCMLRIANRM